MKRLNFALVFVVVVSGCCTLVPGTDSKVDALEAKVVSLYESFSSQAVDDKAVVGIKSDFSNLRDVIGKKCKVHQREVDVLEEMVDRAVAERKQDGQWSVEHRDNKVKLIKEAFDQVKQSFTAEQGSTTRAELLYSNVSRGGVTVRGLA